MEVPFLRSGVLALIVLAADPAGAGQLLTLWRSDGQSLAAMAYPPGAALCRGVAVLSPGAGGSADGLADLAESLASQGTLAVVVGHPESDRAALRRRWRVLGLRVGLSGLATDPAAHRARLLDIAAARGWARARCPDGAAVLIGHSMGAATAMLEAGARNTLGLRGDDAFGAYVALSPQGSGGLFPEDAWRGIRRPLLVVTGTRDRQLDGRPWQARTESFRSASSGCRWLAVIAGATHGNLAGTGAGPRIQALVNRSVGSFLAAFRRGDCRAPAATPGLEISVNTTGRPSPAPPRIGR